MVRNMDLYYNDHLTHCPNNQDTDIIDINEKTRPRKPVRLCKPATHNIHQPL